MSAQTRKFVVIFVIVALVLFGVGILIGYFAIQKKEEKRNGEPDKLSSRCNLNTYSEQGKDFVKRYESKASNAVCIPDGVSCDTQDLPRHYVAHHLGSKRIVVDGRIDDEAWQEVPWTEDFVDIRGPDYPTPYFKTRAKIRWSDEKLYIAGYMEENDFWGTFTEDENEIWQENAFEFFAAVDGSMHNYKEAEISVMNVTWDLMLKTAYQDRPPNTSRNSARGDWDSVMERGVYTDGGINVPSQKGTFWTAEWSFTFQSLIEFTRKTNPIPDLNDAWFFEFQRPQWKVKIESGRYVKDTSKPADWWTWQPTYSPGNAHIPSRWGLVQFKGSDVQNNVFSFRKWHVYKALFEVFEAQHKFKAVNDMFITELNKLDVPPYLFSRTCVDVPIIVVNSAGDDFNVTVQSKVVPSLRGNIRANRYVWFDEM